MPEQFPWLSANPSQNVQHLAGAVWLNADGVAESELSASDLRAAAAALAAGLRARGWSGERVVLAIASEVEFMAAMLACLQVGVIAVPAVSPGTARNNDRLAHFVADSGAAAVLIDDKSAQQLQLRRGAIPFASSIVHLAELRTEPVEAQATAVDPDAPAYIQYTSGSTQAPKGVIITHANLAAQLGMLQRRLPLAAGDTLLNPMPLYHDFGLIMSLHAVAHGGQVVLLPARYAVREPFLWLDSISRYGVSLTATAPFLMDLCLRRIDEQRSRDIDLTSLRALVVGAEPIPPETVHTFIERFQAQGLAPGAVLPAYGLAEATLILSCSESGPVFGRYDPDALHHGRAEPTTEGAELISSGRSCFGSGLRVVSPVDRSLLAEREIGELWVNAPCVSEGFWQKPEVTAETMANHLPGMPGQWLRTGDLAFFDQGHLFLMGRISDIIVIRGENHYPKDIEWTVGGAHPAINFGGVVACPYPRGGFEALLVVCEIRRAARRTFKPEQVFRSIRRAVVEQQGVTPECVVLIPEASIPRTSSGKLARRRARLEWQDRRAKVLAEWRSHVKPVEEAGHPVDDVGDNALLGLCRRMLRSPELAAGDALVEHGMDSLRAAELVVEIEQRWGVRLDLMDFDSSVSVDRLVAAFERGQPPEPGSESSARVSSPGHGAFTTSCTARLQTFTARWDAPWRSPNRLVFGANLDGTRPPLAWCFQAHHEFRELAKWLGPDQPLFGMRSAHNVAGYDDREAIKGLATLYLDELEHAPGDIPQRFGGNCQGSLVAVAMARKRLDEGQPAEALFLLENLAPRVDPRPLPIRVAMFFGEDSFEFNPYRLFPDPTPGWEKLYPAGHSVDLLGVDHGMYFRLPGIEAFSKALMNRLDSLPDNKEGGGSTSTVLERGARADVRLAADSPLEVQAGASFVLRLEVRNVGAVHWAPADALVVANHWLSEDEAVVRWLDGHRGVEKEVLVGQLWRVELQVEAPVEIGHYVLEADVVEQGVAWFSDYSGKALQVDVEVVS